MQFDYNFGNDYYKYLGKEGWKCTKYKIMAPEQSQPQQPGLEYLMTPRPIFDNPNYVGSGKLKNKVAIITGGDSGLGRAAAIAFVKEGAKIVIPFYNEKKDALDTKSYIEKLGGECLLLAGDIADKSFCEKIRNFFSSDSNNTFLLFNFPKCVFRKKKFKKEIFFCFRINYNL